MATPIEPFPLAALLGYGSVRADASILAAAERHRLELLLFERLLQEESADLPTRTRLRAISELQSATAHNRRLLKELLRVLRLLGDVGIPALPLKGPVLVWLLWRKLSLRRCRDIDILVPPHRVAEAVAVLVGSGYQAAPQAGGLVRETHLQHQRDGFVLDLHWNVAFGEVAFPLEFADLWADRRTVSWEEGALPFIGPEWLFLITCVYLVKDYPWPELIYLSDLAQLIVRFSDLDWDRLASLAAQTGASRICTLGLALVGRLPGAAVPSAAYRHFAISGTDEAALSLLLCALANPRHEAADNPVIRLRKILGHAAFRERLKDKLWVYACFVPILLHPGRKRAGERWMEASLHRLRRLAEGITDLTSDAVCRRLTWGSTHRHPAPGTSFHPVDEAGILVSAAAQEIYSLTPSAAFLWACLEEGLSARAMARRLAAASGRPPKQARADVRATLDMWRNLGLVERPTAALELDPVDEPDELRARPAMMACASFPVQRFYRLFTTVFEVGFGSAALCERVDPALRHLATTLPATAAVGVDEEQPGSFVVTIDGQEADRCDCARAVGPMVKGILNATAVNRGEFAFYLHAAMLQRGEAALLLPGAPQSGKTCLSAALAQVGFSYRTDEITLLDSSSLAARGAPVALTVKQNAWRLLEPLFPEIADLPVHRRVDGKIIKYLPPPTPDDNALWDRSAGVRWIVFPRYTTEGPNELSVLPHIDALRRLTSECLALRLKLDRERMQQIVDWIVGIACYELTFSKLDAAVRMIQDACGEERSSTIGTEPF